MQHDNKFEQSAREKSMRKVVVGDFGCPVLLRFPRLLCTSAHLSKRDGWTTNASQNRRDAAICMLICPARSLFSLYSVLSFFLHKRRKFKTAYTAHHFGMRRTFRWNGNSKRKTERAVLCMHACMHACIHGLFIHLSSPSADQPTNRLVSYPVARSRNLKSSMKSHRSVPLPALSCNDE